MEQTIHASVNDALANEAKEKFFVFTKATWRRPGVICRLASIPVSFLAILLYLVLPVVNISYASYSSSTTFSAERALRFPNESIYGSDLFFGGSYFSYYLKSKNGPELLYTSQIQFNTILLGIFIALLAFVIFGFALTFSKKLEKFSKIVVLGYFVCGIGVLCSPIWFMAINQFGNTYAVATTDLTHYFLYDSLYVHDAAGAVVSCLVFIASAALYAIGGSLENRGGDNRGNDQ